MSRAKTDLDNSYGNEVPDEVFAHLASLFQVLRAFDFAHQAQIHNFHLISDAYTFFAFAGAVERGEP